MPLRSSRYSRHSVPTTSFRSIANPVLAKGCFDVRLDQVGRNVSQVMVQHVGFLCGQSIGNKSRVDEHVAGRAENPERLAERGVEVVDLLDDVATPHEVEVPVGERKILHDAHEDIGAVFDAGALDSRFRTLDVHLHGIDADACRAVALNQPSQVRSIAATGIEKP